MTTSNSELSRVLNLAKRALNLYKSINLTEATMELEELEAALQNEGQNCSSNFTLTLPGNITLLPAAANANLTLPEPLLQMQHQLDTFNLRATKTRIIVLKKMAQWAFDACSNSTTLTTTKGTIASKRRIDAAAFYSAVLLVHLNLAKYVGVAACHPGFWIPTRDQIQELFVLADADQSGFLDPDEEELDESNNNTITFACYESHSFCQKHLTLPGAPTKCPHCAILPEKARGKFIQKKQLTKKVKPIGVFMKDYFVPMMESVIYLNSQQPLTGRLFWH
jgi:hypothetical protein